MRSNSVWRNHNTWVCLNHLPCVRYPAGTQACWYYGCKSVRPAEKDRPVAEVPDAVDQGLSNLAVAARAAKARPGAKMRPARAVRPVKVEQPPEPQVELHTEPEGEAPAKDPTICAWKDCVKTARPNSKYCSRNCSNKNARWRHRQRSSDDDEIDTEDEAAEEASAG